MDDREVAGAPQPPVSNHAATTTPEWPTVRLLGLVVAVVLGLSAGKQLAAEHVTLACVLAVAAAVAAAAGGTARWVPGLSAWSILTAGTGSMLLVVLTLGPGAPAAFGAAVFPALWLLLTNRGAGLVAALGVSAVLALPPPSSEAQLATSSRLISGASVPLAFLWLLLASAWLVRARLATANAATTASERMFRRLREESTDLVFEVANDGTLLYVNRAWERAFGYTKTESAGLQLSTILPDDQRGQWQSTLEDSLARDEPATVQLTFRSSNGRLVFAEGSLTRADRGDDAPTVHCVFRDITERRELLRRMRAELDAAEQSEAAKTEFVATVCHEIRSPLNGLLGSLELLEVTELDPEQKAHLERMKTSGRLIRNVVNPVLDLERLRAGRAKLSIDAIPLRRLLHDTVEMFLADAARSGLALELTLDPSVPAHCRTDGLKVQQIVTNLVANALKFTEQGYVRVAAWVIPSSQGPDSSARLRISVRDSGAGIPAEQQGHIFEPFEQLPSEQGDKHSGTGLGLAICARLCQLLGGSIALDSAAGEGAEFTVSIPIEDADADDLDAPSASFMVGSSDHPSPLRVLVAEDDPVNQLVLRAMLEKLGHSVDLVPNGAEAIAAAERTDFDVFLTDIRMPAVDGIEATRRVRAKSTHERPFIIISSANALASEREACFQAGANHYLSKPFQLRDLRRVLTTAFESELSAEGANACANAQPTATPQPSRRQT